MADAWQAAAARHHFSGLIDAAVDGRPQIIRRRDGREVVLVSKEYFEQTKPSLKSVLLSYRFGDRGDVLDKALEVSRTTLGSSLAPHDLSLETNKGDHRPRHRRSE